MFAKKKHSETTYDGQDESYRDYESLRLAIEWAKSNGYLLPRLEQEVFLNEQSESLRSSLRLWAVGLVMSHEFAKTVFGDRQKNSIPDWQYHLMEMALSNNPFEYLRAYILAKQRK